MENMYHTLFKRIISKEYTSDTWLREEELAKEFNTSRTSVRKYLSQLEQDCLVEILPKRGARVIPFSVDDIMEIYDIRKALEVLALDISINTLNLNGLIEIRDMITNQQQSYDYETHTEIDEKLHRYIFEASGQRRLISMLQQLYRVIQNFMKLGLRDKNIIKFSKEEHLGIIDALCLRDIEKARELLKVHLQNSKTRLISKLIKEK